MTKRLSEVDPPREQSLQKKRKKKEPHVWAGASAGGHLGGGPSIRSSPEGPDEAIDTPTILLHSLQVHIQHHTTAM